MSKVNIKALIDSLRENKLLSIVHRVSEERGEAVYLVGGYIRDQLLGEESNDYDFVVNGNSLDFSRQLANKLKGKFILLDEETETARIVYRMRKEEVVELDFKKLKEGNIIVDLGERDFTINAICTLVNPFEDFKLIDPFGGLDDLQNKIIKVTQSKVFSEDPLRMLRAVRLACELNFKIEANTLRFIRSYSSLLSNISPERIVSELFSILQTKDSYPHINLLGEMGLLSAIIPGISCLKSKHATLWQHSLKTFKLVEEWSNDLKELSLRWHTKIKEYLVELIADNRSRLSILKFFSLLHPLDEMSSSSSLSKIARGLRLSNRECQLATKISRNLSKANHFLTTKTFSNKTLYSFFKNVGIDGIGILIVSLADCYQENKEKEYFETINEIFDKFYTQIFLPPLLNGEDIIKNFKLVSGPLIGQLLIKVEERRAEGKIKDQREALKYVEALLKGEAT